MSDLSSQMVSKMSTAVNAFKFMDKDGSGSLTLQEICDGLREIDMEFDYDVLKRMVENADLSYDGSIEYPEFIRFFIGKFVPQQDEATQRRQRAGVLLKQLLTAKFDGDDDGGISAEELRHAFRDFDKDGDGWVSPHELEKGLVNLGIKDASHAHLVCELLTSHDGNDDGMINYHEFIALSGLEITDRTGYDVAAGKGGATQGFKALSNFDQNVLKREKLQRIRDGGQPDIEPDTPKGHTAWRKRYLRAYCGTKYQSESEREAAAIVSARAKKGFVRDPVPLTGAEKMYFTHVLGAERDDDGVWKRSDTHVNNEYFGEWKSQAHDNMNLPFSTKHKPAPNLPRVDMKGLSEGLLIPSNENPALSRETGPFRRVNLLTEEYKGIQDKAIRESVSMASDGARKLVSVRGEGKFKMSSSTKELRKPNWQTRERHKPLKKVAEAKMGGGEDGDVAAVETSVWTNGQSLRGPIDIESPFSRFGGMWSLLDSAGGIIDQSELRMPPPPPQSDTKPLVTNAFEHRDSEHAPGKLSSAGKLTTDTDAYIFHSPPMSRDLFARTLLGSHSSGGLLPAHMVNRAKSRMQSPAMRSGVGSSGVSIPKYNKA
uniref:EF-hand domain-containing protein n=2 Tax=Hemiselmis andersenii TaxID=464988 RepID=A0A7S1HDH7_HEMAN